MKTNKPKCNHTRSKNATTIFKNGFKWCYICQANLSEDNRKSKSSRTTLKELEDKEQGTIRNPAIKLQI